MWYKVARYSGVKPIEFIASYGGQTTAHPGDYLVLENPNAPGNSNYYRVGKDEYEKTYNQPGKVG